MLFTATKNNNYDLRQSKKVPPDHYCVKICFGDCTCSLINRSGAIVIRFSQKIEYTIARCLKSFHGIQEVSPDVTDNIWKITLNKTTDIQLQIHCNNVKTIDMVISDETCGRSEWRTFWSMVTETIRFQANDTASVFYRYGSGK